MVAKHVLLFLPLKLDIFRLFYNQRVGIIVYHTLLDYNLFLDAIRSMQEEFQREKSALKAELDVIHKEEIDELKKEHATALEEELRKRKLVHAFSYSSFTQT